MKGNIVNKELKALEAMRADVIDFRDIIENSSYSTDEDYKIVKQALKRNEPMKLKRKRVKVGIYDEYRIDDYCPTCDEDLIWESNYCPDCGQKVDWSED